MSDASNHYDAIILGAGGAGLMCAGVAAQLGKRILLIDHADSPGKKILISGGGRCNFTNVNTAPDRYISQNKHFAKSALSRYTARDFITLVDSYDIAHHEKTLGQLFCDGPARQIVDMLLSECAKGDVEIKLGAATDGIHHDGTAYNVVLEGKTYIAPKLVVATGGPSIPKMGATGFAYDLARQFGLKVVEPRPALVPLTLGGDEVMFRELSGVSADVIASAGKMKFREAALFTHRGLSGPSILQISSYWKHGEPVRINFLPDETRDWLIDMKREKPAATLQSLLSGHLSARLAAALSEKLGLHGELANLPDRKLNMAAEQLAGWSFHPNGSEGYAKAEVTAGGISTAELSSKTMEAKKSLGLYVSGEAVDVTGWLGGYNFQWAWASGWAAAQDL